MNDRLTCERRALRDELLAERQLSMDDFWARAEARLDWPLEKGVNLAQECCDRWADDRARLALSVHDADGSVRRWTYYELMRASSAVANVFLEHGLERGDRVAAVLDQQVEAYVVALAAWRAGMVYVPLFVGFGVDALTQRIASAECSAIVVGHRYRDVVADVQAKLSDDPLVVTVVDTQGQGSGTATSTCGPKPRGFRRITRWWRPGRTRLPRSCSPAAPRATRRGVCTRTGRSSWRCTPSCGTRWH